MTDPKKPKSVREPSRVGGPPSSRRAPKPASPPPLTVPAREPASFGAMPKKKSIEPPALIGGEPAASPATGVATSGADEGAEAREHLDALPPPEDEMLSAAAEMDSAMNELRQMTHALGSLIEALPK
jgi:hypothetical protein